jgi:hypothetical protein
MLIAHIPSKIPTSSGGKDYLAGDVASYLKKSLGTKDRREASLTATDVQQEPETSTPLLYITTQASRGKPPRF